MKKQQKLSPPPGGALFAVGAAGYSLLEVLWRGYTHWSMTVTGGLCLTVIYRLCAVVDKTERLWRCLAASAVIIGSEYLVGCVVNLWLGQQVWDYSAQRHNCRGQICARFCCLWFLLCIPLCAFCDWWRSRFDG